MKPKNHRDKYADKRPARSRSCRKANGTLKRPLNESQARTAAANLTAHEATEIRAYERPDCGWWHTGHAR